MFAIFEAVLNGQPQKSPVMFACATEKTKNYCRMENNVSREFADFAISVAFYREFNNLNLNSEYRRSRLRKWLWVSKFNLSHSLTHSLYL